MALSTGDGKTLWHAGEGAGMQSSPISYELDGRQYILTSAGGVMFSWALPEAINYRVREIPMRPDLIAASFTILRKNRQLLVFPILSTVSVPLIALAFLGFGLILFHGAANYTVLFALYCCCAFGGIFFNCALAACAQETWLAGSLR